jgi:hypothetical protein
MQHCYDQERTLIGRVRNQVVSQRLKAGRLRREIKAAMPLPRKTHKAPDHSIDFLGDAVAAS